MSRLNPRVDFAFKKLFGSEENEELLIAFINAVVEGTHQIKTIQLLNPYNNKDHPADKLSILDIKATDEAGRHYNIEIQITDQTYYNRRTLYYWSKLYASQLREGEDFGVLTKTISINVLNFTSLENEPDYHNVYRVLNVKTRRCGFEDLEIHCIELPKFDDADNPLKTALDRWVSFLKKADKCNKDDLPGPWRKDKAIVRAMDVLDTLYLSDKEREIYDGQLKWLRDEASAIKKAKQEAKEEGLQEGHEKGHAEGGLDKACDIARAMLVKGMDISTVAEFTGLTHTLLEGLGSESS